MTTTDGGFWPDPPRATRRYAAQRPAPPWPPRADLCLAALSCAARDPLEYGRACALACRVFDREPTPPPKARWTDQELARERVAQVEMRTVTRLLSGCLPAVDALAKAVYRGRRADQPLTWGERHLLDCYSRKDASAPNEFKRPGVLGTVLCAMDRPADDSVVGGYRGLEVWYGRTGCPIFRVDTTGRLLADFVATDKQPPATRGAWDALLDHLWGR